MLSYRGIENTNSIFQKERNWNIKNNVSLPREGVEVGLLLAYPFTSAIGNLCHKKRNLERFGDFYQCRLCYKITHFISQNEKPGPTVLKTDVSKKIFATTQLVERRNFFYDNGFQGFDGFFFEHKLSVRSVKSVFDNIFLDQLF